MSRIPFWLVILFALILCAAAGVTLLHRSGLLNFTLGQTPQATVALPVETGLIVTAVERRNPGILIVEACAAPQARVTLARNNDKLVAETAESDGRVSLPARLTDPYSGPNGWLALQLIAEGHQPLPLLVKLAPKAETPVSLWRQTDGSWHSVTAADALAVTTITETPAGDWQLSGQRPGAAKSQPLLVQLYGDDTLLATAKPAGDSFILTLPKAQRPQQSLRIDIYNATTAQPIVRLQVSVPPDRAPTAAPALFEKLPAALTSPATSHVTSPVTVWVARDAAAQQGDPTELRPGQIVPVAASEPAQPR